MRNAASSSVAVLAFVAAFLALSPALDRVPRLAAQSPSPSAKKLSRIDRLEAWIQAVNQHDPGAVDDEVDEINLWTASDLLTMWVDVASVASLVRDPGARLFFIPADKQLRWTQQGWMPMPLKPVQVFYSVNELKRLQGLAASLGGPADGRENILLKRGAMLHADIAMLAPADARPERGFSPGPQSYRLHMNDGRPTGLHREVDHFDMGRRLLDGISIRDARGARRGPAVDEAVRVWYVATCAHMLSVGDLDPQHFARALELFPKDADVLFTNAVLHETLAGSRRQAAFRAADVPAGIMFPITSSGNELRQAERLYRRALESDPDYAEARLRLGRVLGQRGQHQDAVAELQKAAAAVQEPLLQYYAALFLAGELEAIDKNDDATRWYERAASLFPGAQSPRLAISRLAPESQRAVAREALLTLAERPGEGDAREDPWWLYDVSGGRDADGVLGKLHDMLGSDRR